MSSADGDGKGLTINRWCSDGGKFCHLFCFFPSSIITFMLGRKEGGKSPSALNETVGKAVVQECAEARGNIDSMHRLTSGIIHSCYNCDGCVGFLFSG